MGLRSHDLKLVAGRYTIFSIDMNCREPTRKYLEEVSTKKNHWIFDSENMWNIIFVNISTFLCKCTAITDLCLHSPLFNNNQSAILNGLYPQIRQVNITTFVDSTANFTMLVEILKSCGNLTHMCTAKKYIVSWLNHHLTISPSWHQLYHDYIPSF